MNFNLIKVCLRDSEIKIKVINPESVINVSSPT